VDRHLQGGHVAAHVLERDVLKSITDYLAAEGIWFTRVNTGAVTASHNGKKRFFRFGQKGMADILATPKIRRFFPSGQLTVLNLAHEEISMPVTLFVEVKRPGGKQTPEQLRFELECAQRGHAYLLADSVDAVMEWLKERR
jgi:hypothetical protein